MQDLEHNSVFRGDRQELERRLRNEAECLAIELPDQFWKPIVDYCSMLWDWNTKINLTRHTSPESFVRRDLLDSWHVSKCIAENEDVLDVGTGSGVPGVILAVIRPDLQVTLCDSIAKKANVVEDMTKKLELQVPVYAESVQKVLEDFRYDTLTSRAVGPIVKLCRWLDPYWHTFGRMLAIKGPKWTEEKNEAAGRGLLKRVDFKCLVSYPMPGTESESSILQLKRK